MFFIQDDSFEDQNVAIKLCKCLDFIFFFFWKGGVARIKKKKDSNQFIY